MHCNIELCSSQPINQWLHFNQVHFGLICNICVYPSCICIWVVFVVYMCCICVVFAVQCRSQPINQWLQFNQVHSLAKPFALQCWILLHFLSLPLRCKFNSIQIQIQKINI